MRSALHHLRSPGLGDDRGGIVMGWLTKLTVALALLGLVLFDAISVGSTMATVSDQATYSAVEASSTWDQTKDLQLTYLAAAQAASEQNAENVVSTKDFTVDPDGTVHLVITRDAQTLILFRWDRTAKWAHVSGAGKGRSVG
jgi:hypothetical protein